MTTADDENAPGVGRKRWLYRMVGILLLLGLVCTIVGVVLGIVLPREESDSEGATASQGDALSSSSPSSPPAPSSSSSTPVVSFGSFELLDTVPHDPDAFTQGLELVPENPLEYFESTGLYGKSSVRRVDLRTGLVLQQTDLPGQYFGEGLTYFDGKLIQITWREQTAFVYNATDFGILDVISYGNTNGQGWGICYIEDSDIFLVTDGTQFLHTWDASTYELVSKVAVSVRNDNSNSVDDTSLRDPTPLRDLNELEWDIHSQTVLANVWQEDYIVRIDPVTGAVLNQYDLSSLFRPSEANVLNGIAITDTPNEIWVTGKLWSSMYLIRLVD